jgi:phosphatidylglycerol:prolipoprotein diacylglycerol transferase
VLQSIRIPLIGIPIYGFGAMLFVGFVTATWVAARRARREGFTGKTIEDSALVILIGGLLGARLFFFVQYRHMFFDHGFFAGLLEFFKLWKGGLVWYGGVLGAVTGFFIYARRARLPILKLCDLIVPVVVLGLGFGRIGCLLNGCCYGAPTDLPWAVHFPVKSIPCEAYQPHDDAARCSMALHPTQVYSSINAFLLFGLLSAYYPHRKRDGQVAGLLLVLYPPTRFLIEWLRNDEPLQGFTHMTISQNLSILVFAAGVGLLLWLRIRPARDAVSPTAQPLPEGANVQEPLSPPADHVGQRRKHQASSRK